MSRSPTPTNESLESLLEPLRAVDRRIDALSPERASLCPVRRRARSLEELLGSRLYEEHPLRSALVAGVAEIAHAQADAFPDNIFWDFDALVAALHGDGADSDAPAEHVRELSADIADLMHLFGRESAIHFRYVHDFMYGFDWARWVARVPEERRDHGPFGKAFVAYSRRRGDELLALIAEDDATYGRIDGGAYRNPFVFSRDPADERALFEDLARSGLIPVEAWREERHFDWNRPYAEHRERRARELGIVTKPQ